MEFRRLYIPVIMLICFSYPITTVLLLRLGTSLSGANQMIKATLGGALRGIVDDGDTEFAKC